MKTIIVFAVSFLVVTPTWAQQTSTAAPSGSTGTINTDNVPIDEYVPKVIIEGKWGAGPGAFGVAWTYASDINAPEDASGEIPPVYPGSLAVNSAGEIYILDTVNNRIQKYDTAGKYLKSIEVESYVGEEQPIWYGRIKTSDGKYVLDRVLDKSKQGTMVGTDKWFPFYWPLTAQGINIVIDSKDTLYYYMKRVKDGKETGEVWEFRKDQLMKKTTVPMTTMLSYGVGLDIDRDDDSLWVGEVDNKQRGKHYQYRTGKILNTAEVKKQKEAFRATKEGKQAASRPKPKYYLDIDVSNVGIKVVKKLN